MADWTLEQCITTLEALLSGKPIAEKVNLKPAKAELAELRRYKAVVDRLNNASSLQITNYGGGVDVYIDGKHGSASMLLEAVEKARGE
jgi:hypothetical protein